jgi:hypothetical protein
MKLTKELKTLSFTLRPKKRGIWKASASAGATQDLMAQMMKMMTVCGEHAELG